MPNPYLDSYFRWLDSRNQYISQQSAQNFQHSENEANRGLTREDMAQRAQQFQDTFGLQQKAQNAAEQRQLEEGRSNAAQGIARGEFAPIDQAGSFDMQNGQALASDPGVFNLGGQALRATTPEEQAQKKFDLGEKFKQTQQADLIGKLSKIKGITPAQMEKAKMAITLGPELAKYTEGDLNDLIYAAATKGDAESLKHIADLQRALHPNEARQAQAMSDQARAMMMQAETIRNQTSFAQDQAELGAIANALSQHGVNLYKASDQQLMETLGKLTDGKGNPLTAETKGALFQKIQAYKQKGGILGMIMGGGFDTQQTPPGGPQPQQTPPPGSGGMIPSPNASQQIGGPEDLKRLRAIEAAQKIFNIKPR